MGSLDRRSAHTLAAMDSVKQIRNMGAERAMSALRQIIASVAQE
jgi:hypothetical protein